MSVRAGMPRQRLRRIHWIEAVRWQRRLCRVHCALPRPFWWQAIQSERFAGLDVERVQTVVRDIARAAKELHDHGFMHAE